MLIIYRNFLELMQSIGIFIVNPVWHTFHQNSVVIRFSFVLFHSNFIKLKYDSAARKEFKSLTPLDGRRNLTSNIFELLHFFFVIMTWTHDSFNWTDQHSIGSITKQIVQCLILLLFTWTMRSNNYSLFSRQNSNATKYLLTHQS